MHDLNTGFCSELEWHGRWQWESCMASRPSPTCSPYASIEIEYLVDLFYNSQFSSVLNGSVVAEITLVSNDATRPPLLNFWEIYRQRELPELSVLSHQTNKLNVAGRFATGIDMEKGMLLIDVC